MKGATVRYLVLSLFALLIVTCLPPRNLFAMDADDVVQKHLENKGGVQNLRAIKTVMMTGKFSTGGMSGAMRVYKKVPNLKSLTVKLPNFTYREGCDGKNLWAIGPTGFKRFTGEDREKRMVQTLIEPLLDYKSRGDRFEYIGLVNADSVECYKLRYIQATGDTTYSYFDTKNFNLVRSEVETPKGLMREQFDGFVNIDGLVFPTVIMSSSAATESRNKIVFDEIKINEPIDDSIFVMPDSASIPARMVPLPDSIRGKQPRKPGG
jgi:hypothetical protein